MRYEFGFFKSGQETLICWDGLLFGLWRGLNIVSLCLWFCIPPFLPPTANYRWAGIDVWRRRFCTRVGLFSLNLEDWMGRLCIYAEQISYVLG